MIRQRSSKRSVHISDRRHHVAIVFVGNRAPFSLLAGLVDFPAAVHSVLDRQNKPRCQRSHVDADPIVVFVCS